MWAVQLEGCYKPYEPSTSSEIEAAYRSGLSEAIVSVRSKRYIINFKPSDAMKQKLESDPSRSRLVRREGPPAASKRPRDYADAADDDATDEDEPAAPALAVLGAQFATGAPVATLALCWRADNTLMLMSAASLTTEQRHWSATLPVGVLLCREKPVDGQLWPLQQVKAKNEKRPDSLLRSVVQKASRRMLIGTAVRGAMQHLRQEARTKLQKQVERLTVIALEDSTVCAGYGHLCWLAAALGATKEQCGGGNDYKLLRTDAHFVLHATRAISASTVVARPDLGSVSHAWGLGDSGSFPPLVEALSLSTAGAVMSSAVGSAAAIVLGRLTHKGTIPFDHRARQACAQAAAAVATTASAVPDELSPPPAAWLHAPPAECSQPFGAADELYFAADKHVMDMQSFMNEPQPPPSEKEAEKLTWQISGWNARTGDAQPSFAEGSWQSAMLASWPAVASRRWHGQ